MANPQNETKPDLRKGKPGITPGGKIDPELSGKGVVSGGADDEVRPQADDKGGVAEGQVTKSN